MRVMRERKRRVMRERKRRVMREKVSAKTKRKEK